MRLYYDRGISPAGVPANRGFRLEDVRELLERLKTRGVNVEIVETSRLRNEDLMKAYLEAAVPAVFKKYRIRQVFGSKSYPGRGFGRGVPALVVYEDTTRRPSDVYPHEADGRLITIRDFLADAGRKRMRGRSGSKAASRMDERRQRLGPIGVSVADLVREGRRR